MEAQGIVVDDAFRRRVFVLCVGVIMVVCTSYLNNCLACCGLCRKRLKRLKVVIVLDPAHPTGSDVDGVDAIVRAVGLSHGEHVAVTVTVVFSIDPLWVVGTARKELLPAYMQGPTLSWNAIPDGISLHVRRLCAIKVGLLGLVRRTTSAFCGIRHLMGQCF